MTKTEIVITFALVAVIFIFLAIYMGIGNAQGKALSFVSGVFVLEAGVVVLKSNKRKKKRG